MDTNTSTAPLGGATDPLNCDLTTLDTSRRLLMADKMSLVITKAEMKPTRDNTGRYIALELKTTGPQRDIKGQNVDSGHIIFDQVMVTVTGKATPDMVARGMGELVQAARLSGEIRAANVDSWHKQLEGKPVLAQVDFEGERVDNGKRFDAKNVIGRYLKQ